MSSTPDAAAPLTGHDHPPLDGGPAACAVVLLHGYGADGADLIGLAPAFAQGLPRAVFYAPDAPDPCEMTPFGRQWFSLAGYDPAIVRADPGRLGPLRQRMLDGARSSAPKLDAFLDWVLARHALSPDRLALVGFSQGTMMALHVALRRPAPVAGVVGFSGALLNGEDLAGQVTARPPVTLIHGDADEVVPVEAMGAAEAGLKALDVAVTAHVRPGLPHGIDDQGAAIALRFLADRLGGSIA